MATTATEHQGEDLLHLLQPPPSSCQPPLLYIYAGAHSWCAACSAFQACPSAFAEAFSQLQQPQSLLFYLSSDVEDEGRDAAVKTLEKGLVGEKKFTSCISGSRAQEVMRRLQVENLPALFQVTTGEKNTHKIKKIELSISPVDSSLGKIDELEQQQAVFRQAVQDYEAEEWSKALRGFSQLVHLANPSSAVDNHAADSAFNIAAILQMLGHTHLAVYYTALTLELRPDDTTAHILLGTVLAATEREAVIKAYRRLVSGSISSSNNTKSPNPRAEHRLAVLTGEGASAISAGPNYVKEVFDDLAECFEEKLVQHLQYRVPWELHEAVATLYPPSSSSFSYAWRILDLGMGTGLCGKLFFPDYCGGAGGEMIGCDLSPKMVAKAEESKAYTEVHVQDVHDALRGQAPGSLDLVLSADTFIYVGKLDECFALTAKVLRPGSGLFAFSIEVLLSDEKEGKGESQGQSGFRLLESGRYAQSDAYVLGLLKEHGLDVKVCKEIVVRKESTVPIQGRIYVAEKKKEG